MISVSLLWFGLQDITSKSCLYCQSILGLGHRPRRKVSLQAQKRTITQAPQNATQGKVAPIFRKLFDKVLHCSLKHFPFFLARVTLNTCASHFLNAS